MLYDFKTTIDGKDTIIQYSDDLTFGDVSNIMNQCFDIGLKNGSEPKINVDQEKLSVLLLLASIKKFPKELTYENIKNLNFKKEFLPLMKEITSKIPLNDFLLEYVETIYMVSPTQNS